VRYQAKWVTPSHALPIKRSILLGL
jgi:hypothetical protein